MASPRARTDTPPRAPSTSWETLTVDQALAEVGSSAGGITRAEAAHRIRVHGPNALPRKEPPGRLRVFVRQFRSPLIYLLGVAGGVAAALGEWIDAGFILLVLSINALVGSVQEWRAEQGAHALQRLMRVHAVVEREGEARTVDAETLAPGDVVWLEAGARVPADVRLLTTFALEVDESLLTGESTPVVKNAAWIADRPRPVGDRANVAHAATTVVRGRASGVVVATGLSTQVGRVARDILEHQAPPVPLLVRMKRFTRLVGGIVLVSAVLLVGLGVALGQPVREMLFLGVAAAVSAIPEGLPVALTVCLAIASGRMAKRHVIVRRLAAVEGLGSCTLIATDKTGTLTMNALTVRVVLTPDESRFRVTGEGFEPVGEIDRDGRSCPPGAFPAFDTLVKALALCNEATLRRAEEGQWTWTGDPTDVAMLALAGKHGVTRERAISAEPQIDLVPFDPAARYAATFHRTVKGPRVYVKGAPERVIAMCSRSPFGEGGDPRWMDAAIELAREGYRVIAVAEGPEKDAVGLSAGGLTFLGLVGMIDPPRPGVREAVRKAKSAGVEVVMVTGDHPVTALAIARDLGIADRDTECATGEQMTGWEEADLLERVKGIHVFARVAPHQKLLIVNAARANGHFVAVTGDGVNDAPALRAADIGVAMGKDGTDVARDAADIVLADDNFASVVHGIEEGRVAYSNVRNVTFLLVSTGAAELLLLTLAVVTSTPIPLLPAQLLWLNLVTNGVQDVALGMEPKTGDELERRPRRPNERVFNRLMVERTLLGGAFMGLVGFAAFHWMLKEGWGVEAARNGLLLLLVLFENVHIGNSRSELRSAFSLSPLRNPVLLLGAIAAQGLHVFALYFPPLQEVLRVQPVALTVWVTLYAVASLLLVPFEVHKVFARARAARERSGTV